MIKSRHFVVLFLLAALLFPALVAVGFAAEYVQATELTSGQYVLVTEDGHSAGLLDDNGVDMPWITISQPKLDNGVITDACGAVWTLTVTDSGVTLQDANGTYIAPAEDGLNGISGHLYYWSVTREGNAFSFHGTSADTPMVLALNGSWGFRAYAEFIVDRLPTGYLSRFTLYRLTESQPEVPTEPETPAEPEEPTEPEIPTEPEEPTEPEDPSEPEEPVQGWGLYFGQLHSHCDISDGSGTVSQAFAYAAQVEELDFLAVTDHSDSFDNAGSAAIGADAASLSEKWAAGKTAAQSVTNTGFVGIYGYEMSWPIGMNLGHISTFNTPGFQSWQQDAFHSYHSALQNYYEALTSVPASISQFNHPGTLYGNFRDFSFFSQAYDAQITLLEVGSGSELPTSYDYYNQALDAGWHVAPTNNQNNHRGSWGDADSGRTVVYAESLTENGIYDALRNYRCYATEDRDLSIFYYLDGHFMGSLLEKRDVGDTVAIRVELSDPTDVIGRLEVIADGGTVIAGGMLETQSGIWEWELPSVYSYYYIRVTQPDGDTAVTAPIWVDGEENAGISGFSCDKEIPVQGESLNLTLKLYNEEAADLTVESIIFSIDGEPVGTLSQGITVGPGETKICTLPLVFDGLGYTEITADVTASLGDSHREYREVLSLSFRISDMVTGLLVDGTHGSLPDLAALTAMAVDSEITVTQAKGTITAQMLENCRVLLLCAPEMAYEWDFLELVREFVNYGGSVILCGASDEGSGDFHSAAELNRLLSYIGSTMTFQDDTLRDPVNNGGTDTQIYPSQYNSASPWLANASPGQVYRCIDSCTIQPGSGTWLVKGFSTAYSSDADGDGLGGSGDTVVLAWEETTGGGSVFAAGSAFFTGPDLAEPANIWDAPYLNRTIWKAILGDSQVLLPLSSIETVRQGNLGQVFRIRGYVTAGTSNPGNTFPDTLYLQDDTGGIAVVPFRQTGIQVGTPLEVVGYLDEQDRNNVFQLISWDVLDADYYRYLPLEGNWQELMDNSLHGGTLVQVEGTLRVVHTAENSVSSLVLEDAGGNFATVYVEEGITSGSTGERIQEADLEIGGTIRAIGLLHMRSDGVSVVRVRNCDEVVYVPPVIYVWKQAAKDTPRVGDDIGASAAVMVLSGWLLLKRKRKK